MTRYSGKKLGQRQASQPPSIDAPPANTPQRPQPARPFEGKTQDLTHRASRPERDFTRADEKTKQNLRYCDYYCFMSLKDFTVWVQKDDGSEPSMSYSEATLAAGLPLQGR